MGDGTGILFETNSEDAAIKENKKDAAIKGISKEATITAGKYATINLKRILIISPNFPPVNTADMQRIRQTLPYLADLGWEPVIITVDEKYADPYSTDDLLMQTIPANTEIHRVKAWNVRTTRKFGLGSLAMRSYFFIQKKGDELLKNRHFDLIYFSTTAFHVMALGPRWKKKFGVPFILDIQDPWRSDFYLDKPKSERPPKFFVSYNIDKYLEAKTVPQADGIISVSKGYCDTFLNRYPVLKEEQFRVIPFGASAHDFGIMKQFVPQSQRVKLKSDKRNIVYVGRGGHDMRFALEIIFNAFRKGLEMDPATFGNFHLWFIGTSYATQGMGNKTIEPVAKKFELQEFVTEVPDRIPYFETLFLLDKADMLLVPGSTDESYTASKIYPYVLAGRPLLAVFYKNSSVVTLFQNTHCGKIVQFDHTVLHPADYSDECLGYMKELLHAGSAAILPEASAFRPYTAESRAGEQVGFFNDIVSRTNIVNRTKERKIQ